MQRGVVGREHTAPVAAELDVAPRVLEDVKGHVAGHIDRTGRILRAAGYRREDSTPKSALLTYRIEKRPIRGLGVASAEEVTRRRITSIWGESKNAVS